MKTPQSLKHRSQAGFTILELIAVIIIIVILLVLIIITHTGVQRSERNTERQRDIKELRVALEAYYEQNQRYPTLTDVNDSKWRAAHMKGLEDATLQDPLGVSANLADKPAAGSYAYKVTSAKGGACDDQKNPCTKYALTATLEGGGTFTKNNLN